MRCRMHLCAKAFMFPKNHSEKKKAEKSAKKTTASGSGGSQSKETGGKELEHESLILAQDERWRRA